MSRNRKNNNANSNGTHIEFLLRLATKQSRMETGWHKKSHKFHFRGESSIFESNWIEMAVRDRILQIMPYTRDL